MIKFNIKKWENADTIGNLLFFAQMMDTYVNHETCDSFRSKMLNSHSLSIELLVHCKLAEKNIIPIKNVNYIIEEIEYRITKDKILKSLGEEPFIKLIKKIKGTKDLNQIKIYAMNLYQLFHNKYWNQIIKVLDEELKTSMSKKDIAKTIEIFIAELYNRGYSNEYIYMNNYFFFFDSKRKPSKIDKIDLFSDYIENLNGHIKKWSTYIPYNGKIDNYKSILDDLKIKITKLDEIECPKTIKEKFETETLFLEISKLPAMENHTAFKKSKNSIETILSILKAYDHKFSINLHHKGIVFDEEQKKYNYINSDFNPMLLGTKKWDIEKEKFERNFNVLFNCNKTLQRKLLKVINSHSNAIDAIQDKSKLLTIWSSLESIMTKILKNKSNIENYIDTIKASENNFYFRNIIKYVEKRVKLYNGIFKEYRETDDYLYDLISLILFEDKTEQRNNFMNKLDSDPVLKYHINWINNNFSSTEKIYKSLMGHQKNVEWQLQRIYQARNMIVHDSDDVRFSEQLIICLHTYFDNYLELILSRLGKFERRSITLEAIEHDIINESMCYIEFLKKERLKLDKSNYRKYLNL